MPTITLTGCTPVPLAHYLKALGVLRLVSESSLGDTEATGFWKEDHFVLDTRLDRGELLGFFLHAYVPAAVLAPWNGGGGFFFREGKSNEKDPATGKLKKTGVRDQETAATRAITAISTSECDRLSGLRSSIKSAKVELLSMSLIEAPKEDLKAELLNRLRNQLSDEAIRWMDATVVLGTNRIGYPPLLGTGGTDCNLDFTNNFIQRITEVIHTDTGCCRSESEPWLRAALFAEAAPGLATESPIGQFFPGATGGVNATSGFDAPSSVNPWDFILMMEGALLFAAGSVKRLESADEGALIYPFCVRQAGVGYASAAGADEAQARCEMWMPLWQNPTSSAELSAVFGEGRAQVRGRPARTGVDFAQAVVTLGVDRGFSAFQRYGFQVRNGLSHFATPLERLVVRRNQRADLLADIEVWHDRLRQKAGPKANPEPPASVARALNQLERRILEVCRDGGKGTLLAVLASLGAAERALAKSFRWTTSNYLQPLRGLAPQWLDLADDGSPEFRLASALASVGAPLGRDWLWFRQHLEPITMGSTKSRSWANWAEQPGNDVVWHDGDLVAALNAILSRRLVRFEKAGTGGWFDIATRYARLDDITAFIEGRLNETFLADLLWGIACVGSDDSDSGDVEALVGSPSADSGAAAVPSAFYALIKLCHHGATAGEQRIPLVPAIAHRAMNGDGKGASELASRRLTASGCSPLVKLLPVSGEVARRTVAAMLFPISPRDSRILKQSITHKPKDQTV